MLDSYSTSFVCTLSTDCSRSRVASSQDAHGPLLIIDWTSGDGAKGWDSVGVIAIIAPPEHDDGGIEWTYFTGEDRSGDSSHDAFPTETNIPDRDHPPHGERSRPLRSSRLIFGPAL